MIYTKIYSLEHPITGEIRYIGQTRKSFYDRLHGHLSAAKRLNKTDTHKWITTLAEQSLRPIMKEVDTVLLENWDFWERYYVSLFKGWGFNLTNHTNGGKGIDMPRSKEWAMKVGARHKGKITSLKTREKLRLVNLGNKLSAETKQKLSISVSFSVRKRARRILQYSKTNEFIKEYTCVAEAVEQTGLAQTGISNNLNNRSRSAGGYVWKYKQ